MAKWELAFQDILNHFIPGALPLSALIIVCSNIDLNYVGGQGGSIVIFILGSYVLGHVLDGSFRLLRAFLIRFKDLRTDLLKPSYTKGGIPGLVEAKDLRQAIKEVFGGSYDPADISNHPDAFYACWRLVEAEVPDGTRYLLRANALFNFGASMFVSGFLSTIIIYNYLTEYYPSPLIFIVALLPLTIFCRTFVYYYHSWIHNVYRLFWTWYRVQYRAEDRREISRSNGENVSGAT